MGAAGTVVILAAGQGTRMRSARPKVMHELCGRAMLGYVLDQALALEPERVVLVVGAGAEGIERWLDAEELSATVSTVVQREQLGTGDAVRCALGAIAGAPDPVVVLYGDMPCLSPESVGALAARWNAQPEPRGAALLTVLPEEPRGFGRVVRGPRGVERIVEERDCTPEEREIAEVNVGVYAFRGADLAEYLPRLSNDNAQREYYLTDVVLQVLSDGRPVEPVVLEDPAEAVGVNTLAHLAECRAILQERILGEHLAAGVQIEDPATTYIDHGVEIGAGTRVLPCTVIRRGVRIGRDCEVGPFTHLRADTVLCDRAEVGNFTEAKKSVVGEDTKAKHLTYLGDVEIGAGANIGAGTIVANYDGSKKHRTVIGDRAFIGSGTVIVAPSTVGAGALTGAGAIVTRKDIPEGEVWVGLPARRMERGVPAPGSGEETGGGKTA